jgi:hypothetical protein
MNIFISTCDIKSPEVSSLVTHLQRAGFKVTHSLEQKLDAVGTYGRECLPTLKNVDVLIVAITKHWRNSSSMKAEAIDAANCFDMGGLKRLCYFNPESFDISGTEMCFEGREPIPLLRVRLPDNLEELVEELKGR